MLEFKKIEIDDIEIYKKFFPFENEFTCENSFLNLLIWQSAYNNTMAVCDDMLFIKSGTDEQNFYLPFGKDMKKGVALIREYCGGEKPVFYASEGAGLSQFKKEFSDQYSFKEIREYLEYIYLRDNLANLVGKKFHSKRNHINAFSKKYAWHYEAINDANIPDVKECAKLWYQEKADKSDWAMQYERAGLEMVLNNMEKLSAKGGAIYVDGRVVAFTVGAPINSSVFNINFEKALADFSEGYAVINREFAKNELTDYKYINREDDMGVEGLRRAKLSYYPEILLKKYIIR